MAMLILIIRICYMQLIDDQYIFAAKNNILRKEIILPSRGIIKDCNNNILVSNQPIYNLFAIPKEINNIDIIKLCNMIDISQDILKNKLLKINKYSNNPILIKKDISDIKYAVLQEHLHTFKGFFVQRSNKRNYHYGKIASHAIGYVSEVENNDIINSNGFYNLGDYIGRTGIEYSHEKLLHGKKGIKFTIVDVFNRIQQSFNNGLYDTNTVIGNTLITTIDLQLQKLGEELMQNKKGSIVAINPKNGNILAFVSSPTYDPRNLIDHYYNNYNSLKFDNNKPLLIRPIQAQYPPGSLLKPVIALIGLEENIINSYSCFTCNGKLKKNKSFAKCCKIHGNINLMHSIVYSCNNWYCNLLTNLFNKNIHCNNVEESYNKFKNYLESFGIGSKSNIEIPFEATGTIKTSKYYNEIYGINKWKSSNIISLALGQGEITMTPIQMANIMVIIANKGFRFTPHLIKKQNFNYNEKIYTAINPKHFDIIYESMKNVVEYGTAKQSKIDNLIFCGKTGTSQQSNNDYDHSIFGGFAPYDNPIIAIAVVVENGGFGSKCAAPIASIMIKQYINKIITKSSILN